MPNRLHAAVVLCLLALLGCLIGVVTAGGSSASGSRPATSVLAGGVTLEYPEAWRQVLARDPLSQLHLLQPVVLAPHGRASEVSLVVGTLQGADGDPLPQSLLASLPTAPLAQVVETAAGQSYRYRLQNGTVELYVRPTGEGVATGLACYAAAGSPRRLRECGEVAAGATQSGSLEGGLVPDAAYASGLTGVLAALERERRGPAAELSSDRHAAAIATPASQIAGLFAHAADAVAALGAPSVLEAAQSALARALEQTSRSYLALSRAAEAQEAASYERARDEVASSEAAVDSALARYAVFGYPTT